jgi:hypothetical protein
MLYSTGVVRVCPQEGGSWANVARVEKELGNKSAVVGHCTAAADGHRSISVRRRRSRSSGWECATESMAQAGTSTGVQEKYSEGVQQLRTEDA